MKRIERALWLAVVAAISIFFGAGSSHFFAAQDIVASAPFACDATTQGRIYFNTTSKTFLGCDATSWRELGATGTANTMARFDANGTALVDSQFTDDGLDVLGYIDGQFFTQTVGINSHFGPDLRLGSSDGPRHSFQIVNTPAAGTGGEAGQWVGNPNAANGSDVHSHSRLGFIGSADHTGTGNVHRFLSFQSDSNDVDTVQVPLHFDTDWDAFMLVEALGASWAAVGNPPTNQVAFRVDEGADRGAGTVTADCALIARLSTGTEIVVAVLVTDGGCP